MVVSLSEHGEGFREFNVINPAYITKKFYTVPVVILGEVFDIKMFQDYALFCTDLDL